jgi:hypothetical protein
MEQDEKNDEKKKDNNSVTHRPSGPDTYSPPALFEIGDAVDLTQGNAAGTNIDIGPVFQRSYHGYAADDE